MTDSRVKDAPYGLRVIQRKGGLAAIIYRRQADPEGRDRLQRIGALNPLAYSAALPMLRQAAKAVGAIHGPERSSGTPLPLRPGPYYPLDEAWGPRVACFALIVAGLRDGERMMRAAEALRHADANMAAWWLGLLLQEDNVRAIRALRILTEAVQ